MSTESKYKDIKTVYRYDVMHNQVMLSTYQVTKCTPCGVWIRVDLKDKFINLTMRKMYACVNKEVALQSFIYRKNRHLALLNYQIEIVLKALSIATKGTMNTERITDKSLFI